MEYGFLHEVSISEGFIEFKGPSAAWWRCCGWHKMNVAPELCGILIAINTVASVSRESKIYEVREQSN